MISHTLSVRSLPEPFFNHTYSPDFESALKALPKRFDAEDDENKKQYYAFIDTFGTHVVTNGMDYC